MRLGRVLSLLKKHRHLSSTLKKYKKMKKNSNSGGNTTNVYVEYMQLDSIELSPLRDDLLLKGMNTPQPQRGQSPSNTHRQHEDESESEGEGEGDSNNNPYPGLPAWASTLRGGSPFLWLGDGRAVGKMHFDPFDNLLVQVCNVCRSGYFKLLLIIFVFAICMSVLPA